MIVKGQEWTENDSEYILVMEYMNDADYFKEKIETVHLGKSHSYSHRT